MGMPTFLDHGLNARSVEAATACSEFTGIGDKTALFRDLIRAWEFNSLRFDLADGWLVVSTLAETRSFSDKSKL
jgi:hypothetical protein